jgi:hypothetical protein
MSCLGASEGKTRLLFVPEQPLMVEISVHSGEEFVTKCKLHVPGIVRLEEVGKLLKQELKAHPLADVSLPCCDDILWGLGERDTNVGAAASSSSPTGKDEPVVSTPTRGVAALVGSAAAAVTGKRKSLGGETPKSPPRVKRRRSISGRYHKELGENYFIGDLFAEYCSGQQELPSQFLCPISLDVMHDPVVVSGSGNTYDRKSIERHFQTRHTDPISNIDLRKSSERKLVPNNTVKSQVIEAERSRVDLRLLAFCDEPSRSALRGDMGAWGIFKKGAAWFGST